jgi:hypothetical protein
MPRIPAQSQSPVFKPARDKIREHTRILLITKAGGRCEFDGCNEYLLQHPLTFKEGFYGAAAHIVAYRIEGPRGRENPRPADINVLSNLMLLCPACHTLIDSHPRDYTRSTLEAYKTAHEGRVRYLTGLGSQDRTTVLVVKAPIGGNTIAIPFGDIVAAVAPRYPVADNPATVDLGALVGQKESEAFLALAMSQIDRAVESLMAPGGSADQTQRISVFALGPIPLLIYLGSKLSNKVPTEVYQRHRDTEDWKWKPGGATVSYTSRLLHDRGPDSPVSVVMSISGTVDQARLPDAIVASSTIYELTVGHGPPSTTLLRTAADVQGFRLAYQELLATIGRDHPGTPTIELFPAIPAPIAVLCGRELLPKAHPSLRVYDYDKTSGVFRSTIEVNAPTSKGQRVL